MTDSDYYNLLGILCLIKAKSYTDYSKVDYELACRWINEAVKCQTVYVFGIYDEHLTPKLLDYGDLKCAVRISLQLNRTMDYFDITVGMRALDHYWFANIEFVSPHTSEYDSFYFGELS